jgi:hypothetical protein
MRGLTEDSSMTSVLSYFRLPVPVEEILSSSDSSDSAVSGSGLLSPDFLMSLSASLLQLDVDDLAESLSSACSNSSVSSAVSKNFEYKSYIFLWQ